MFIGYSVSRLIWLRGERVVLAIRFIVFNARLMSQSIHHSINAQFNRVIGEV